MTGAFQVYRDRAGKHRWRLKASNGQVVGTGAAYETRANALKGCEAVIRAAAGAPIVYVDESDELIKVLKEAAPAEVVDP